MSEIITYITEYSCYAIFVLSLMLGFIQIFLWIFDILIKQFVSAEALYNAYAQYLKNKYLDDRS